MASDGKGRYKASSLVNKDTFNLYSILSLIMNQHKGCNRQELSCYINHKKRSTKAHISVRL
jgi:hypothetical protein